jgi:hypothetical protein
MPQMISKPEGKPLLVLLVKRAVLFLFALCLLAIFLYSVGTVQEFLDATQIGLLRSTSGLGLLLAIGAAYGIALDVSAARILKTPRFLLGAGAYFVLSLFGILIAAIASFILVTISGNVS